MAFRGCLRLLTRASHNPVVSTLVRRSFSSRVNPEGVKRDTTNAHVPVSPSSGTMFTTKREQRRKKMLRFIIVFGLTLIVLQHFVVPYFAAKAAITELDEARRRTASV